MSLTRVSLVLMQALTNSFACTPPNPTQEKTRYHKEELYILQIAPLIFKVSLSVCPCLPFLILITQDTHGYYVDMCLIRDAVFSVRLLFGVIHVTHCVYSRLPNLLQCKHPSYAHFRNGCSSGRSGLLHPPGLL